MTDRSIERSTMLAGLVGCLLLGAEAGAQKVRAGDPIFELEKRIENVATEACEQLTAVFPLSESTTADCVDDAVDGAMEQARAAIEAATGR